MVAFDTSTLSLLIFRSTAVPLDFRTDPPVPISDARERLEQLIEDLHSRGEKILLPDPVIAEFLVVGILAGGSAQQYLGIIRDTPHFIIRPFGTRAAVEVAERLAAAIKAGDKREGEKNEPWQKLKYDRQIIAVAVAEGSQAIYSTDKHIHNQPLRWGLTAISPADLPKKAVQLKLPDPDEAEGQGT